MILYNIQVEDEDIPLEFHRMPREDNSLAYSYISGNHRERYTRFCDDCRHNVAARRPNIPVDEALRQILWDRPEIAEDHPLDEHLQDPRTWAGWNTDSLYPPYRPFVVSSSGSETVMPAHEYRWAAVDPAYHPAAWPYYDHQSRMEMESMAEGGFFVDEYAVPGSDLNSNVPNGWNFNEAMGFRFDEEAGVLFDREGMPVWQEEEVIHEEEEVTYEEEVDDYGEPIVRPY